MKAIIIDDEKHCTEMLRLELEKHCPQIEILGMYNAPVKGLAAIVSDRPDVVFLDIEMPLMNGFELLEKLERIDFEVIFTTAYDQFAIKAIRISALDYLLKPIGKKELIHAVKKLAEKQHRKTDTAQFDLLMRQIKAQKNELKKIALPTREGLEILNIQDIIYAEASGNYAIFHFKGKGKLVISKTLKEVSELLEAYNFFRIHQSYLINLEHIQKYVRTGGSHVVMHEGAKVAVAKSRREVLVRRLQEM